MTDHTQAADRATTRTPEVTHTLVAAEYPTLTRTKCGWPIIETLPNRGLPPVHAVAQEEEPTCTQCARV